MENPVQGKVFGSSCFGEKDKNREKSWITWNTNGPNRPIYKEDWYFIDETASSIYGPFETKKEADLGLSRYATEI